MYIAFASLIQFISFYSPSDSPRLSLSGKKRRQLRRSYKPPDKMAILSGRSSNNWIFTLKVLLISAGVCSLAVILKLSLPQISSFLISELPLFWSSLRSWLTPPYLYFVINGIIITIAASSRFQQKIQEEQELVAPVPVKTEVRRDFAVAEGYEALVLKKFDYDVVGAAKDLMETTQPVYGALEPAAEAGLTELKNPVVSASEEDDDEYGFVISRSNLMESTEIPSDYSFVTEKPLVSVRFGHRKNVKSSPEAGRSLRVTRWKRNDTLESTWKTITDGRQIPLARHLKKSETWDTVNRYNDPNSGPPEASPVKMNKSETFKDRNSNNSPLSSSRGSGKLRRESSLGQDELNRRVEAFIKKFNEEMRLQRQESLNQYHEMINRGADT